MYIQERRGVEAEKNPNKSISKSLVRSRRDENVKRHTSLRWIETFYWPSADYCMEWPERVLYKPEKHYKHWLLLCKLILHVDIKEA